MEEETILLSELLRECGNVAAGINLVKIEGLFIAAVDIDGGRHSKPVYICPCRKPGLHSDLESDISFTDIILEKRVSEKTGSPYFCWRTMISSDFELAVEGEYYTPSRYYGTLSSYMARIINSGIEYTPNEREHLLTIFLKFHK